MATAPLASSESDEESISESSAVIDREEDVDADLKEYAKTIGLDPEADEDLLWLAKEAFMAPLPAGWVEAADDQGHLYFCDEAGESCWSHPMDGTFRELIGIVKALRTEQATQERCLEAMTHHLNAAYHSAVEAMQSWSGPYDVDEGQYFHNSVTGVSSWNNPLQKCEDDLALRHKVLSLCLFPNDTGQLFPLRKEFVKEPESSDLDIAPSSATLPQSPLEKPAPTPRWSFPALEVISPRFGEGAPRSPSAQSFATAVSSTPPASSCHSSRRIARSTSRSPCGSPTPSAPSPSPHRSLSPSLRRIAGSSRSPYRSPARSPERSTASPDRLSVRDGSELDLESAIVLKIVAFAADSTAKVLELPPSLNAAQRRKAKSLVEQHPEVKCESFGFGTDRRLHLFRGSESHANRPVARNRDGETSESEALEFTFGAAALAGMKSEMASKSKNGCVESILASEHECNKASVGQESDLERSSIDECAPEEHARKNIMAETLEHHHEQNDVANVPTVSSISTHNDLVDEFSRQSDHGVVSKDAVVKMDVSAKSGYVSDIVQEASGATSPMVAHSCTSQEACNQDIDPPFGLHEDLVVAKEGVDDDGA